MKHTLLLSFLALMATNQATQAQGTLTITFDGPPYAPLIPSYSESGMQFDVSSGNNGFGHGGLYSSPIFPDDGSLYLQGYGHSGYNSFGASFIDGSTFGLSSVDVAAFGGDSTNISAVFRGSLSDGTLLTMEVSGTGIDFQTIHFGPEWSSGLVGIGISNGSSPDGWSIDNLVVIVPEPGTGALLLIGVLTSSFWQRTRRRTRT